MGEDVLWKVVELKGFDTSKTLPYVGVYHQGGWYDI